MSETLTQRWVRASFMLIFSCYMQKREFLTLFGPHSYVIHKDSMRGPESVI